MSTHRASLQDMNKNENGTHNEILVPTPSRFEKLYLAPEQPVAGALRLTFGNPTPIALGGFLLANTPASIMLMGWGGAGGGVGDASAGVGSLPAAWITLLPRRSTDNYLVLLHVRFSSGHIHLYYVVGTTWLNFSKGGAILLYAGGIGEWILGNTFPATVFFTFGGFWATFGATLTPGYAAVSSYATPEGFYNSFATFLIFMCLLCFVYMVAALRTNICLVGILFVFTCAFPCLAQSYYDAARGKASSSESLRVAGGAFAFAGSVIAWYLWTSLVLDSVDFPFSLPVGDLSKFIKGNSEKNKDSAV